MEYPKLKKTGKGWSVRPLPSFLIYKRIILMISLLLGILLFALPIFKLILLSFKSEHSLSLINYSRVLSEPKTFIVLRNTFWVTLGSTMIATLIGIFLAWLVAYSDIRGKRIIQIMAVFPLIIPSYITTLSWTQFMSKQGILAGFLSFFPGQIEPFNIYSLGGIILVMGLSYYPLVFLLTLNVLRKIPRQLEWAARISGCSQWHIWQKITFPLALPGIGGGAFLAFLASLDNFGIPAFLGIPADISVLSTKIYQEIVGFGPTAFPRAAVFSILLGLIALIGTLGLWLLLHRVKQIDISGDDWEPRVALGKYRLFVEIPIIGLFIMITLVPLISLMLTSFTKAYGLKFSWENLTLKHYHFVLFQSRKTINAIQNSIFLAGITTTLCLVAGTVIAYYRTRFQSKLSKTVEIIVSIPYALPGIVLALAMIFTWMEPIPGWNPGIYGTIHILIIAYLSRFMILQVRASMTAFSQLDHATEEAARVCGANLISCWEKILIPLIWPGVISGAFLVLINSLTELTVSSILSSSGSKTMGMVIFNFEQGGYTTYSTAFSSIVVLVIVLFMLGINGIKKYSKGKVNFFYEH